MTTSTLPAYVELLAQGYVEQPDSGVIRSEMEAGPPRQAVVRSRVMLVRPVMLRIETQANYLLFKTWFNDTIHLGADWFNWIDPVDGVEKLTRIRNGQLSAKPSGALREWRISAEFETWGYA